MNALLDQLALDRTFFVELALFAFLFLVLSQVFFKPYLELFEKRHKKTVEDRKSAEELLVQANAKIEEYKKLLQTERQAAREQMAKMVLEARQQESQILNQAREQARQITQEAAESVTAHKKQLRDYLESEVETLAQQVSNQLVSRKG